MAASTTEDGRRPGSLAGGLFTGHVDGALSHPYPAMEPAERRRVEDLIGRFEACVEDTDPRRMEQERWIGDDLVRELGAQGLLGLHVAPEYGGAGLTQTGYYRVFESISRFDPSLAIVLGIHQSIGTMGYVLFGTDEQKERFLPELASGRKLGGFALTERGAGSDAFSVRSRAVRQRDGSWRLNGEKCYVGNASTGAAFVTIARAEVGGEDRHIALIVEAGMDGLEVGEQYGMLGVEANDVRPLRFNDVRIPPENVLGEPGEGFKIAMRILNNGRLGLGAVSVGAAKCLAGLTVDHVREREQFGRPLADFQMVQDKVARMTTGIFALEAMCYLTSGLVDRGAGHCALESALSKVSGSEFVFDLANEALQLRGGEGYMRREPFEKVLRDVRVFPVFEGANDVLRAFIAIQGVRAAAAPPPAGPDGLEFLDPSLRILADSVQRQLASLRAATEAMAAMDPGVALERQLDQRRLADAAAAVYAQVAVLSRVSQVLEANHGGGEVQRVLAEAVVRQAAARVERSLGAIGSAEDEWIGQVAGIAYELGPHGHAFPARTPSRFARREGQLAATAR